VGGLQLSGVQLVKGQLQQDLFPLCIMVDPAVLNLKSTVRMHCSRAARKRAPYLVRVQGGHLLVEAHDVARRPLLPSKYLDTCLDIATNYTP